jgi:uncharacterized membrane protein
MKADLRKYKMHIGFICAFLCFALPSWSQVRFIASASNHSVSVGDQVQITFQLEGAGKGFQAPSFSGFNVLMGPSQSSQMKIMNGAVSQTISYTYLIQATTPGTFKIGAASIESEGKRIQSNELTLVVAKGGNNQAAPNAPQKSSSSEEIVNSKNVFFKASLDKANVYRGEPLVISYRLYTRLTLVNFSLSKMPSLEGFFSYDIDTKKQLEFRVENIEGVQYKVADIKKIVLFPQRSGTLTLDPMEGEVVARIQAKRQQSNDPRDPFNDPFFRQFFGNTVQDVPFKLRSEPVKINVRDLPAGAPASFNGTVGKFTVNVELDKKETKTNDAVTLKMKINGKGNIKLVDPPKIDFPPDFETYDPKVTSSAKASNAGVNGSKSFEYLMIPRNAGEYKIAIGDFAFFDLDKKQYEVIPGSELILKVAKGEGTITTSVNSVSKNDIQVLGNDIRFIKTNAPIFATGLYSFYTSVPFYIMLAVPLVLFIILLFYKRRNAELQNDQNLLKSRKANQVARKRLRIAKKLLDENKTEAFLDEMSLTLWGFIRDRLQIPVSELSKENIATALSAKDVSVESINLFIETLDSCEMARYAKGIAPSNKEIYEKGIKVISKLEEEIK